MINNDLRNWIRHNSKTINDLARAGHRCPKLIIDAYSQYQRTLDERWLNDLTTNVHTFVRWQTSAEGKAAIEALRTSKQRSNGHARPQQQRQRVDAAQPKQRVAIVNKNGRAVR